MAEKNTRTMEKIIPAAEIIMPITRENVPAIEKVHLI